MRPHFGTPARRSPIAEAVTRVALSAAPRGVERWIVVISDGLEVSAFGEFECGMGDVLGSDLLSSVDAQKRRVKRFTKLKITAPISRRWRRPKVRPLSSDGVAPWFDRDYRY